MFLLLVWIWCLNCINIWQWRTRWTSCEHSFSCRSWIKLFICLIVGVLTDITNNKRLSKIGQDCAPTTFPIATIQNQSPMSEQLAASRPCTFCRAFARGSYLRNSCSKCHKIKAAVEALARIVYKPTKSASSIKPMKLAKCEVTPFQAIKLICASESEVQT